MTHNQEPRAWTKQEVREKFIEFVRSTASYWADLPDGGDIRRRCHGVGFSILSAIDGSNMSFPMMDLTLKPLKMEVAMNPHPDDKEYLIEEGSNYFEPGMVFNDDVHLHDLYYRKEDGTARPDVESSSVEFGQVPDRDTVDAGEFDHFHMSLSNDVKIQLLPIRLMHSYMQYSFANQGIQNQFWKKFGEQLGGAISQGKVGEIGHLRVMLTQMQNDDGSPEVQVRMLRLEDPEMQKPNPFGYIVVSDMRTGNFFRALEQGKFAVLFDLYTKVRLSELDKHLIIYEMAKN
jgi:hypothetical protein